MNDRPGNMRTPKGSLSVIFIKEVCSFNLSSFLVRPKKGESVGTFVPPPPHPMANLREGLESSIQLASYLWNGLTLSSSAERRKQILKLGKFEGRKLQQILMGLVSQPHPDLAPLTLKNIPPLEVLAPSSLEGNAERNEKNRIIEEIGKWFGDIAEKDNNSLWPLIEQSIVPFLVSFPRSFGIVENLLGEQSFVQIPYATLNTVGISLSASNDGTREFPIFLPGVIPFGRNHYALNAVLCAIRTNTFLSVTVDNTEELPTQTNVFYTAIPIIVSTAAKDQVLLSGAVALFGVNIESKIVIQCILMVNTSTRLKGNEENVKIEISTKNDFDMMDDFLLNLIGDEQSNPTNQPMWLHYSVYTEKKQFRGESTSFTTIADSLESYARKALKSHSTQRPVAAPFVTDLIENRGEDENTKAQTMSIFTI